MGFPPLLWVLVQDWKASWLCRPPHETACPLYHPPHLPMKCSNIWSRSVPLSVLAFGSLLGCSPAYQHQAPLLPTLSSYLCVFLSLSSLSPSSLPSFPLFMYVPLDIFLSVSSFSFFTSRHLLPPSQSIFSVFISSSCLGMSRSSRFI